MPEKMKVSALIVQTLATFAIANLTALTGFIYAWPSYTVKSFESNATMLARPMSPTEVNLLGSLVNVGALAATPLCGPAVDKLGRKYSAMLFGLPYVIAWSVITVSTSVTVILVAVAVAGAGAAGQAVSSVYIAEIADDSIRGGLAATTVSGYFLGLLVSYVFGGYLTYHQVVYTHLTLSVLYVVLLSLLKESPVFLVQSGKMEEAAQSISFYRRVPPDSAEVQAEIYKLKLQLDPRIDEILHREAVSDPLLDKKGQALDKNDKETEKNTLATELNTMSPWIFLWRSESSKRALYTVLTLMALTILMGSVILQVYAEPLLHSAAPSVPSNMAAILLAVDFLLASALCTAVVDRCGRKTLTTWSATISACFSVLLAAQLMTQFGPPWVTVLIIYGYIFFYTLGAACVPFILSAEVFLPEVRGICNSLSMGCMWVMNFVTLIIFNPLVDIMGLGPLFLIFAGISVLTAGYSHFCLPETKGLSADAVQLLFLKKHKRIPTNNNNEDG